MKKKNIHCVWFILLGVILIRGSVGGGLNTTSDLFLPPVSQELDVGISTLLIYFSITSIVMVFWLPFAETLINRYDTRVMTVADAVLQTLPFMTFGLLDRVYGQYILPILYVVGATILVSLPGPILVSRWFTKNAGLMMRVQMAFVGLFETVLQPTASSTIFRQGRRAAYSLIGGAASLVVILTSLIFLYNKPRDRHLPSLDADIRPSRRGKAGLGGTIETVGTVGIPEKTAIYSISFVLLLLFMISITGIGVFSQHTPNYGSLLGCTLSQTRKALALAPAGSTIGSITTGIISDRIGSLKTCYGMTGIDFLSISRFLFSGDRSGIFGLLAFLCGLVSPSIMVLVPILILEFYGRTDCEEILTKLSIGAPIFFIILIPAYEFTFDLTKSYRTVLTAMLCLLAIALLSITLGWEDRCTQVGYALQKK